MFATVIVPLDGSPNAELALPYAIDEARRHGARLMLVRVIPRPEPCVCIDCHGGPVPVAPAWSPAERAAPEARATAYLGDVRDRVGLGRETTLLVAVGDPPMRLLAEARRHPRPLVVLTTGQPPGPHPHLGEVARRLLAQGSVPVLGVRQPQSVASDAPTVASRRDLARRARGCHPRRLGRDNGRRPHRAERPRRARAAARVDACRG